MSYSIKLLEMLVSFVSCLDVTLCLDGLSTPTGEQIPAEVGEADEPCAVPSAAASFPPLSRCSVASFPPSWSWISGVGEKHQKSWHLTLAHVETWNNRWVGKNFCHLMVFVIKVMKWIPITAFETTLGSVHHLWSSCTASIHSARSKPLVFCNARWCFSSVDLSCDFSLVSLSSPLRGRPCRDPGWCVCKILFFQCSRTEMQLSLSSVNNRKF